ncbi:MAG: SH3 domain-containing protein [Flavobacteriales bacterium]|nr:SH3 domain-containing protein [Flavobacteriales bacterium]
MRTFALSLLLLATVPGMAMTRVEADSLAAQGSRAYAAGDHAAALALFDSAATAFTSPALLYNIGNCHFKLNDIPHAILYFERALRLAPGDADVQTNLELARQNVVDRVNELPGFSLGSTWSRIRGGRDADQWARRSLWACLAFFVALAAAVAMRQRTARRSLFALSGLLFIGTALSIAFAAFRHKEVTDQSEAIIMSAKVDVRSEPRDGSTVLFVLHKGTKVTILQQDNAWSEVQLANGSVGWMPPASLERI